MNQLNRPLSDRADDVVKLGGVSALAISALTAGGANAVLQAVFVYLSGGGLPELDAEGATAIVNVFVLTAPLAITVGVVVLAFARMGLGDQSGQVIVAAIAGAVVGGLILGNVVYSLFLGAVLEVNVDDLILTMGRQGGPWEAKALAGVLWFVVGYFELFGWQYFVAAIIAGCFPAVAVHWLLPTPATSTRPGS